MEKVEREAYLNEFKGNLFEFSLAQEIAQKWGIEARFHHSIEVGAKELFVQYQQELFHHDPQLYSRLPILARETLKAMMPYLPKSIDDLLLVGKQAARPGQGEFKEADLVLLSGNSLLPISLKLCKEDAHVNTKSAGLKSFIAKYFSTHSQALVFQQELNDLIDREFYSLGQVLYSMADLSFDGHFCEQWERAGLSHLPGELPKEMRVVLKDHYGRLIEKVYEIFCVFSQEQKKFARSLGPLVGVGSEKILQVTCFHQRQNGENYGLSYVEIKKGKDILRSLENTKLQQLRTGVSSFEIHFDQWCLQLRVKPMNVFTTPSYKMNCSVKMKKDI